MTEEKIINSQEVDTGFRIPDGDYQPSINKHLARLSFVKVTEDETSLTRKYTVGSMNYTVRSVFPRADKPTIEDSLKHLMTREVENASSVTKKLSGLSNPVGVYLGCGNLYPHPTLNRFDLIQGGHT